MANKTVIIAIKIQVPDDISDEIEWLTKVVDDISHNKIFYQSMFKHDWKTIQPISSLWDYVDTAND